MTVMDRICIAGMAVYAAAFVGCGLLLTTHVDPVSHAIHANQYKDGLTMLATGYSLCLLTGLLYWQALTRGRHTGLYVNGKPVRMTGTTTAHRYHNG